VRGMHPSCKKRNRRQRSVHGETDVDVAGFLSEYWSLMCIWPVSDACRQTRGTARSTVAPANSWCVITASETSRDTTLQSPPPPPPPVDASVVTY